jgi:hypothetical protein
MVAQLGPPIERIGAARSTRYALRRPVRNFGSEWPVYRITEGGRPQSRGVLRALHGGFRFVAGGQVPPWMEQEYGDGLFPGLPFFLQDVRPQGYLGRAIARDVAPRLAVPPDLRLWSDDDALSYFLVDGYDLPGDFVVGDHALERAHRAAESVAPVADADRARVYPELAAAAQRGEPTGSSAGGEQPKFPVTVRRADDVLVPVLVKFSAAEPSPVSARWADLLACEDLAAAILRERGVAGARTELIDAGGRRFLEVERFDRRGGAGRLAVLTLGAIEDAFLDAPSADWATTAARLEQARWIDPKEGRTLRWVWCFGDLIANTDMHRANASFWFTDAPPWRLTPFYDMLPMQYAPGAQGELAERPFAPRPPLAGVAGVWSDAAAAALDFWERVGAEARISPAFRATAGNNRAMVARLRQKYG